MTTPRPARPRAFFQGAETGRLQADWFAGNFSPDYESRGARRVLRARARQLVRDNAYAAGFVAELANNVVGPQGIRLRAGIRTLAGEPHKSTNDTIEAAFADWGMPENASADGHDSWVDLQKLIIQTVAVDGECLVRHRKYFNNAHGYALQIIDADQLDDFYNVLPGVAQNEVRSGVEINSDGAAVAYHIWTRHPSDSGERVRTRVDAREMKHLFVRYRPNQTRGITWFAPVLTSVKMHDGYTEAELVAARTAAAKMGFIVNTNPEMGLVGSDPKNPNEDRIMEAAAGTFETLAPGEQVQAFDPQHPNAGFKDFTKVILRGVARGLGISYTALTGDLESVNYSSIRTGMLSERDNWKALQVWLSVQLHRPVYRQWVSAALLTGALRVDSRIASDYQAVAWKARGWSWIDPLKDIQARVLGMEHGLDSRTETLDEEGGDIEETFANLAREKKLAEQYGIDVAPVKSAQKTTTAQSKNDDETEDGDQTSNRAAIRRVG